MLWQHQNPFLAQQLPRLPKCPKKWNRGLPRRSTRRAATVSLAGPKGCLNRGVGLAMDCGRIGAIHRPAEMHALMALFLFSQAAVGRTKDPGVSNGKASSVNSRSPFPIRLEAVSSGGHLDQNVVRLLAGPSPRIFLWKNSVSAALAASGPANSGSM